MPIALAIGGGVASLAGGIGNYAANKSAQERAEALQNQNLQQWIAVAVPDPEQQKIALKQFVQQGTFTPELERAIQANPSEFQKIIANPTYKGAQNRALSELEDIGYDGGLRLQDKAAIEDATLAGQARDRGNRDAISADMARRGMGGSGFDVAAKLQGQQATADQLSNQRLKIAAGAQDRALQAIEGAGDLAGKYRTQDFGEQSAKASAADRINLFNTTNLQDVQQRNLASQNAAAAQNLKEKQRIADSNIQQSNYEQEYNKKLAQQKFQNEAQKASGTSGQYQALAQNAQQQGQNLGNLYSNIGGGVANAATAGAQWSYLDDYLKNKKAGTV